MRTLHNGRAYQLHLHIQSISVAFGGALPPKRNIGGAVPPSELPPLMYKYVHMYMHTYMYIHIYIYIHTCTCSKCTSQDTSTYLVPSIDISSTSNESFHCMGMASLSSNHHCSGPPLYSDKVSLGESELQ